ncbi:histidine phosphatase family protein [Pseudomonas aeruginosa]|nr:histidine phosphatase family protein [Pseudomonas aeruginosa]HBO3620287.1 histidine phosphatase family protein [Pseudomonas aeruginosa]HCF5590207.1 histidine phosphatase family protein [Pseudomonas aeruginosa]
MGSIYLIRHGQASFGADDYDVLSPTGIRQAEILGDHLLNLGVRFDRVLSGGLRRQQHTARAALERLESSGLATPELEVDPAFNEFEADAVIRAHLPDLLEKQPEALHILRHAAEHRAEFQRLFSTIIARWVSGNHEKDGLESWQEFLDKVHDGLRRLLVQASGKDRVAVFTSGGTITALLQLIVGVPPLKAFELNWQIVNTSLTRLKFRGEEVSLASFNSHVHLELLKAPELITYR